MPALDSPEDEILQPFVVYLLRYVTANMSPDLGTAQLTLLHSFLHFLKDYPKVTKIQGEAKAGLQFFPWKIMQ